MKYNCLIIDDEKPARDLIKSYVEKIDKLNLIGECENALDAVDIVANQNIDILFLDIQMPGLTGIDFIKTMTKPPAIILITAYENYAIEGFELDVIDYLLKPVEFQRFFKAVTKAIESVNIKNNVKSLNHDEIKKDKEFIFIKTNKELVKVAIKDIIYVESLREYVQIITDKQKLITYQSIYKFNEVLPQNIFFRCHRSYIVNVSVIDKVIGNLIFIGKHRVPVSRGQRESFLEFINSDKLF